MITTKTTPPAPSEEQLSAELSASFQRMTTIPLEEKGFLRLPGVLKVYPVSRSTWLAGVRAGIYPPAIKLSKSTTAWKIVDILDLCERLGRQNNAT